MSQTFRRTRIHFVLVIRLDYIINEDFLINKDSRRVNTNTLDDPSIISVKSIIIFVSLKYSNKTTDSNLIGFKLISILRDEIFCFNTKILVNYNLKKKKVFFLTNLKCYRVISES